MSTKKKLPPHEKGSGNIFADLGLPNAEEHQLKAALVVQLKRQEGIVKLFGRVRWEGNLDEMRASRFPDWDGKRDENQGIADTPAA